MKIAIALFCTTLVSFAIAGHYDSGGSSNHIQTKGGIGNGYIYPVTSSSAHGHSQHGHSQHGSSQHGPSQHGPSQHGYSQHGHSQHGQSQHGFSQHGHSQHGHSQQGHSQHGYSQHGHSQHGPSQHGQSQHGHLQYGPSQHGHSQHGLSQSVSTDHHQQHIHSQSGGYSADKPSHKIYKIIIQQSPTSSQYDSGSEHQQQAMKTIRVLHENSEHQSSHNEDVPIQTIKLIHVHGNSATPESSSLDQSYGSNIPAAHTTSNVWQ